MSIHPTAIISKEARLSEDVIIGPYAIIDGPVTIGPRTRIDALARIVGPVTMGAGNVIHSTAVIGDWPQDRKHKNEFSETLIGDDNIFREGVTIHRGTGANTQTIIGSRCFFMATSHVGHNCRVGDDVTLINSAALGGHVQVGDRVIIGAHSAIHQFCRVGRLCMISNGAGLAVDLPPFFISMATNTVTQLNAVGLRRSGMPHASINALRQMFRTVFRTASKRPLSQALADLPPDLQQIPEIQEFIAFCKQSKRGVARFVPWSRRKNLIDQYLEE